MQDEDYSSGDELEFSESDDYSTQEDDDVPIMSEKAKGKQRDPGDDELPVDKDFE